MSKTKDPKRLAFAICEFLKASIEDGTIKAEDAEGMDISIACIGEAFGFDFSDAAQTKALSIKPATLSGLFDVYVNAASKAADAKTPKDATADKAKAEEFKAQGNKLMADKKFKQAISKYSEAIALDASNAVYFANRAAAYSQDGDHANAVEDSRRAIEVDPDYSKAYSRMGHAHFCLGNFAEAVESYESGLRLDPGNAAMKQSLASAKARLAESGVEGASSSKKSAPANPFAGGMPGMGAGGMPDFASMMSDPNFMKMASSMMGNPQIAEMMKNPAIAEMAQNMMKDPSKLSEMMDPNMLAQLGAMGGAPGGSGASGEEKKKKKKK
ncbi:hypothetical protein HDU80_011614 [Chytriomyces hyalinus]|nr:hypothetical protein HDU80_011614 [Chytriomyces hyalinus]